MIDIRPATTDDVPAIAALLHAHMRDAFGAAAVWDGSPEALARDGFGLHFQMIVATRGSECVAAFRAVADLAGKPARAIIRGLPDKQRNWEP